MIEAAHARLGVLVCFSMFPLHSLLPETIPYISWRRILPPFYRYVSDVVDSTASTRGGQFQCGVISAIQLEVLARETLSLGSEALRRNVINLKLLVTLKN